MAVDLSAMDAILSKHPRTEQSTIQLLQDVQREYGYVPRECIEIIAKHVELPVARVYAVATFYKAFSLKPKGETVVRICAGTACHIRGAGLLIDEVERSMGLKPGQTSDDGKYTIETVACVGACAMGPCVTVNGQAHGNVRPDEIVNLVKGGERDAAAE